MSDLSANEIPVVLPCRQIKDLLPRLKQQFVAEHKGIGVALLPVLLIGSGLPVVSRAAMLEAAINEHSQPFRVEHEVRTAR